MWLIIEALKDDLKTADGSYIAANALARVVGLFGASFNSANPMLLELFRELIDYELTRFIKFEKELNK